MVKIDKHIPLPPPSQRGESVWSTIKELEVGESFAFDISKRATIQSYASRLNNALERRFVIRKIDENTARLWRES